jgi:hypothetical protein
MHSVIDKLDPKIIQHYRKTGNSAALDDNTKAYIQQIERAMELFKACANVSRAATLLQREFKELSLVTSRKRVYDCINFFHVNNTITNDAWNNFYADRYEAMAQLAAIAGDYKTMLQCTEKAHLCRISKDENKIDPDLLKPVTYIVVSDRNLLERDKKKRDINELKRKYLNKEFESVIEKMPVDDKDKLRLKQDAGITEVEEAVIVPE